MSSYTVTRSIEVAADPATCHALVDDFHAWTAWSPWEGLDPDLERTYTGPDRGVGARYAWNGNRKAGRGSMAIVGSSPQRVDVDLRFEKPWKAEAPVSFLFDPAPTGTTVTWTMTGRHERLAAVFARFINMDKLLGRDFERGLTRLKATAEQS